MPAPSATRPSTTDELPSSTARAGPTRCTSGPASGIAAIAAAGEAEQEQAEPGRAETQIVADGGRTGEPSGEREAVEREGDADRDLGAWFVITSQLNR